MARREIEWFNHLIKTCKNSVQITDLPEEEIIDTLTLLSWYIHQFWKNLTGHIFSATKLIAGKHQHLIDKLPDALQYIYDPD